MVFSSCSHFLNHHTPRCHFAAIAARMIAKGFQQSLIPRGVRITHIKSTMPNFSKKNPSTSLQRKLCIKSNLISLPAREQSQRTSSNLSRPGSTLEHDADVSMDTSSHGEEWEPAPNGSDDDDSSRDSYMSYCPSSPHPSDETDDDNDLVAALSLSPPSTKEDVSYLGDGVFATIPSFGSSTMHQPPTLNDPEQEDEYPSYNDDLQLDAAEITMLDLLVLCDSSGARRGFYDDLLTLLRHHIKKGFIVTKAKGRDAFLSEMRKKVPTPQPKTTKVAGWEVVHFSFVEMLRDLLRSSKFNDTKNLCINREENERFARFVPMDLKDFSETMSRQWASETYDSLEGFDPDNDLFFPINLYANKMGTDVNQRYLLEPFMFTSPILRRRTP